MSSGKVKAGLKKALRGVSLLVVGTSLGVLGAVAWLTTESGNGLLRRSAEGAVRGLITEGSFQLEGLHTDLVDGIVLRGLHLEDGEGNELIAAERIVVDWELRGLLRGHVSLGKVRLDSPVVDLRTSESDGRLRLLEVLGIPAGPDDPGPPEPWGGLNATIVADVVEIRDGSLRWSGGGLEDLQLDGRARIAGRVVDLPEVSAFARIEGPVEGEVGVDLSGQLAEGDLVLSESTLRFERSSLTVEGRVDTVETAPVIDLALRSRQLRHQDLSQLAGDPDLFDRDLALDGHLHGPLDDLRAQLEVDARDAGRLQAALAADLLAEPPTWSLTVSGDGLEPSLLMPTTVTTPVSAERLEVELAGSGLSWPDVKADRIRVEGGGVVVADERVDSLLLTGSLDEQRLAVEQVQVVHAAGQVDGGGAVDFDAERVQLSLSADLPRLSALSDLVGQPLSGAVTWQPEVDVRYGQAVVVDVRGPARVRRLDIAGVSLEQAVGPLRLRYADDTLELSGGQDLRALRGESWSVDAGRADWQLSWSERAGLDLGAELDLRALGSPLARASVAAAEGTATVRQSAGGSLSVTADLQLQEARTTPAGRPASGPLTFALRGDDLSASLGLRGEAGQDLLVGDVEGTLSEDGHWTVRDLSVQPLEDLTWRSEGALVLSLRDGMPHTVDGILDGPAGRVSVSTDPETLQVVVVGQNLQLGELSRLQALVPTQEPQETVEGAAADAAAPVAADPDAAAPDAAAPDAAAPDAAAPDAADPPASDPDAGPETSRVSPPPPPPPVQGTARLAVTLDREADGRITAIDGVVEVEDLTVPGQLEVLDLRAAVLGPIDRPAVAVDLSTAGRLLVTARGDVPIDIDARYLDCGESLDLRAIVAPSELAQLRRVVLALPAQQVELSADLVLSGDACDPDMRLVAAAESPLGQSGEVVRFDLVAERDGDKLHVESYVEEAFTRRLRVNGDIANSFSTLFAALRDGEDLEPLLDAGLIGELALAIEPRGVPIEALRTFVDLPGSLAGRFAGGFLLGGRLDAPRLQGALQLSEGQIGSMPVEMGLLTLLPAEGGYVAELMLQFGVLTSDEDTPPPPAADRSFKARAVLPLKPGESIDALRAADGFELTAKGRLPLALAEGIVHGVGETEGQVDLDLTLGGTVNKPTVQAAIDLDGGALTYDPLGIRYEDITIEVESTEHRVLVRQLSMTNRRRYALGALRGNRPRTLEIRASADLEDYELRLVRATGELDGFWISGKQDRTLAVNGKVSAQGAWPSLTISGDLEVAESQLYLGEEVFGADSRLQLDPVISITRADEVVRRTPDDDGPALWESFNIDVDVDLLRNLRLEAKLPLSQEYGQQFAQLASIGLDAELGGKLKVRQSDGRIVLQGEVEPLRGTTTVFGVKFDLEDGVISFLGDSYDNPFLDITAVHSTSYGDVDVHVTGFAEEPEIELSSAEFPDKTDVVTLLLLGKPASAMTDGEGQSNVDLVGMALASLSGQVERVVGTSVFDQLEYDPAGAIRIGKALSDRLFLRLEQQLVETDEGNRTEVTLEYLITRRLYAEFTTGDRGASSANLYWRWRF